PWSAPARASARRSWSCSSTATAGTRPPTTPRATGRARRSRRGGGATRWRASAASSSGAGCGPAPTRSRRARKPRRSWTPRAPRPRPPAPRRPGGCSRPSPPRCRSASRSSAGSARGDLARSGGQETMSLQTMAQAIATTLDSEMARDERVVVIGEDVGKRGGVFLATEKLFDKYGPDRVIDSPLSEAAIIGAALGMAVYGIRPVAEIQFSDYVFPGFDQLVSQVAKVRYRSGGAFTAPMVVRMPAGGGVRGGHHHSQNPDAHFVHTAGLKVVYPSTPSDAAGLLRAAIRDDDPVVVMEPKRLYRAVKEEVPEGDHVVAIGEAAVRREGDDVV